jgi:hypothetical protein
MKTSLLLITSIIFCSSYGQKKDDCEILKALLKHNEAKKVFYFDKHTEVPIVFVDTHNCFKDCAINDYYGRKVRIVHDSSYINQVNYSNIIINTLPPNPKKYMVSGYYKIRNALFYFNYKRWKGKIVITKFEGGYF